jgi:branched-chain amino acid transport system permease protein
MLTVLIAGICTGGIYALLAVPFNFQIGALKVTNFAYGNILMLAMYLVFITISAKIPIPVLFCILLPAFFIFGLVLRRYVVFTNNENAQILITMGLAIFFENMAQSFWGSFPRSLGAIEQGTMVGEIYISITRLEVFAAAILVLGIGYLFLNKSWYGRCIRALVQQRDMAEVVGINTKRVSVVAFAASFCYVIIAAFGLMMFYSVEPHSGHSFLSICFLIAVLGGIGNIAGSFFASFIIGIISAFVSFFLPGYHDPILFSLFILMLLIRPSGLFGEA